MGCEVGIVEEAERKGSEKCGERSEGLIEMGCEVLGRERKRVKEWGNEVKSWEE